MLPVIATVPADGADESMVVEQAVSPEENKDPERQLSKDKVAQDKLRKLMNFTLVGTVLSGSGKSVAIIEDNRTSEQKFYRMGDLIRGGHIVEIAKDKVVLIKDGVELELKLNSGTNRGKMAPIAENNYDQVENAEIPSPDSEPAIVYDNGFPKIEREVLDSLIHADDYTIPVTALSDGRFRVDDVKPDSALSKLGFRSGDMVSFGGEIKNKEVSSSKAFAQGLQQRFGENMLRMEVEHNGEMEMLYVEIEDSSGENGSSETQE